MKKNPEPLLNNLVSIQNWLRPDLTQVLHNRDHRRMVDDLEKLDHALKTSELETKAIKFALDNLPDCASALAITYTSFYGVHVEVSKSTISKIRFLG